MVTTLITVAMLAANKPSIYYGPEAKLGQGTVKSYVAMNAAGDPTAVGLIMTEAALEGLPNTKPAEGDGYELVLSLPKETKSTVFNHIGLDWNPVGHVPIGVYNVPHFDFHFYMMSESARKQITLKEDDMKRCQEKPPADMIPEGYIYAPESEIKFMGAHWVDLKTPELNGGKFTQTFIYGSYAGKVNFIEPMVSLAFLQSKPNLTAPIKQPKAFAWKNRAFPTEFSIRHDSLRHTYTIELGKLK